MMAFNPNDRYQTPGQLLDAVRSVRQELDGGSTVSGGPTRANGPRTTDRSVFLVEKNPRYQDAFREALKKCGYKVFLSTDPTVALNRYRTKPYDALILDAAGGDEECAERFDQIMDEAAKQRRACVGVLLLSDEQNHWARHVEPRPTVAIMGRQKLTLRKVVEKVDELWSNRR
jgi:CheY-like chemotaxis protein